MQFNIVLALIFAVISGVFEEKAIVYLEKVDSNIGLLKYLLQNIPALGMFLGAGVFFVIQNYFLREAGAAYGLIAFGIWSAVVVGLLLFESPEIVKKSPLIVVAYILAMALITGIQIYIFKKEA